MHAVAQTHAFDRAADHAGMTKDEIASLVEFLAEKSDGRRGDARHWRLPQGPRRGLEVRARAAGIGRSRSIQARIYRYF